MQSELTDLLLAWYQQHARELPWRGIMDPYMVWVSEIMLQQTRIETVIPYYQRWIRLFPTLSNLASASQQDVLTAWEGMGYYSRARNLHKAAQVVINEYGGQVPRQPEALRRLPGVGRYTAGAIASIAFGLDEPVLEGNIRRLLARLFNITEPARSIQSERRLWKLVADHLPSGEAGAYNQALMDLGALICTPRLPNCPHCPLAGLCQACQLGVQEQRPVTLPRRTIPHINVAAAVIERDGNYLITQRPAEGLLGSMWEFPGGKLQPGENLAACLEREIREELAASIQIGNLFGVYHHAYTHFRVTLHAFCCHLSGSSQPVARQVRDLRWTAPAELSTYPMGKIDRQIASRLLEQNIC